MSDMDFSDLYEGEPDSDALRAKNGVQDDLEDTEVDIEGED